MEGAFCLVEDLLGGSTDHNSACLSTCAAWGQGKEVNTKEQSKDEEILHHRLVRREKKDEDQCQDCSWRLRCPCQLPNYV